MKRSILSLALVGLVVVSIGCSQRVPAGYYAMVQTAGGINGDVLKPGHHGCWGRDVMLLVEAKEEVYSEALSILCADDLNFKFDLKIRARIKPMDKKKFAAVLLNKGSDMIEEGGGLPSRGYRVLTLEKLYTTYIHAAARSIARDVVSKYQTTEIRDAREAITKMVRDKLMQEIQGTPMEITMVATSNFDYPDIITKAVENARKRELEIKEERAKQAMELLKADNRLKIAQKLRITRAAEAQADAAYIAILGRSLTGSYLRLKEIEAKKLLYEKVAQGDKVIVGGQGAFPVVGK